MLKVYPYKQGSKSAKALADALGVKRVRLRGSKLRPNRHTYINWGNPREPERSPSEWLNRPWATKNCSNKSEFFTLVSGAGLSDSIPDWCSLKETALGWDCPVIARTHLRANGGRGAYYLTHEQLLEDNSNYLL